MHPFPPCLPTRAIKVPDRPEWIHEVKHDGYRLIVQRDGKRVRLFTRNGHDWTDRYPRIVVAALRNRNSSFVMLLMFGLMFVARGPHPPAQSGTQNTATQQQN